MGGYEKIAAKVLGGTSDANILFRELCELLLRLGFDERIRGDHHIFTNDKVVEIVNLQPTGAKAKPYQVKQVRNLMVRYKLGGFSLD